QDRSDAERLPGSGSQRRSCCDRSVFRNNAHYWRTRRREPNDVVSKREKVRYTRARTAIQRIEDAVDDRCCTVCVLDALRYALAAVRDLQHVGVDRDDVRALL